MHLTLAAMRGFKIYDFSSFASCEVDFRMTIESTNRLIKIFGDGAGDGENIVIIRGVERNRYSLGCGTMVGFYDGQSQVDDLWIEDANA
jgi:hypothetical protein